MNKKQKSRLNDVFSHILLLTFCGIIFYVFNPKNKANGKVDIIVIELDQNEKQSKNYHSRNPKQQNHPKEITQVPNEQSGITKSNIYEIFDQQKIIIDKKSLKVNSCTEAELMSIGVSKYTAKNWCKYIASGGKIKQQDDVLKIYGMTQKVMKEIQEYLLFPQEKAIIVSTKIEVNTSTIEEWQSLKGIGQVLSKRIIKFRDLLGGFSELHQIKETYGITDSLYSTISGNLYLIHPVVKLNINEAQKDVLASHPYISYHQAKVITKFRSQHGQYNSINELLNTQIIDSTWLKKVGPYLTIKTNS